MSFTPPLPDRLLIGHLGSLVNDCYTLYQLYPNSLNPPVGSNITDIYEVVRYITMEDFYGKSKDRVFYGLLLAKRQTRGQFVIAVRGTDNWYEAWDDWKSMELVPCTWGRGSVGKGFFEVYSTMDPRPSGVGAAPQNTGSGSLGEQIAVACKEFLASQVSGDAGFDVEAGTISYEIAGHSLGSALVTYLAAQLSFYNQTSSILLCTFASPMTGDTTFADWFDRLPKITSWRLANDLDVVTAVPQDIDLRFKPVKTLYAFTSWDVCPGIVCYHSLMTYLFYVDSERYRLRAECVLSVTCEFDVLSVPAPDYAVPQALEARFKTILGSEPAG